MAKITKTKLIQLQKKLKTDAKIGKQFGITRQAVHQLRKKYGIDSVLAKNAERNQKIVKAYKAGKPGTALAKTFGLSISQTYRIINESKAGKKKVKKAAKKKSIKKVVKKKVVKKKPAKRKTNPRAIDTVPLPEKPKKKKKVVKKKVVKKAKKKVVKKKKK